MDHRLANGGPITQFLSRIVAAKAEEDVCEEGREGRLAIVYATKVHRLMKRIPPRTTPQMRRGRQAQELKASVLAADVARHTRLGPSSRPTS